MPSTDTHNPSLVLSYLDLRKAIGIIGMALPFVLIVGNMLLEGPGIKPSISDYYHSSMRNVFVGCLCAIGVFMLSYRGYQRCDAIAGDLACVFAVGVAWFPTAPAQATKLQAILGGLHYLFAAAFFLTLAYFCLKLFRKTRPDRPMTSWKRRRNRVYTLCGYTILGCIALIVLYKALLTDTFVRQLAPMFWLEAIAVLAFGVSWFTKGEGILQDRQGV